MRSSSGSSPRFSTDRQLAVAYPTLETDRLVLRPLSTDDLDELTPLHAEESFWRYPFGRGWTQDETRAFLERKARAYDEEGFAVSAVVVRATGELAGWAGLAIPHFLPDILPAVEVGWRLGERFRGLGYATEAGRAWVDHAFADRGLDELVSIYEPANVASGAVMTKLGFTFDQEASYVAGAGTRVVVHVTKLTRAAWSRSSA